MKKANALQRFLQKAIGIAPTPRLEGKVVIKDVMNIENPHILEKGDSVLFKSRGHTVLGDYNGGDPDLPSSYINLRKFAK